MIKGFEATVVKYRKVDEGKALGADGRRIMVVKEEEELAVEEEQVE